jgi:HEAT repeat protein
MKFSIKYCVFILIVFLFRSQVFAEALPGSKDKFNQNTVLSLLEGLNSENLGLRTGCAYMLGELKVSSAIIPLMNMLREDESEEARISAALALFKIGTPMSINAVRQAVKFDESSRVSKLAAAFYQQHLRNNSSYEEITKDSTYATLK